MLARAWSERALYGRELWLQADRRWACALNQHSASRSLLALCRITSRLADGVLWYILILALPFAAGRAGSLCAINMICAGVVSLLIYLVLKRTCGRVRPYEACPDIRLCGKVLDKFSFPSGHTLHSVGFSLVLVYHFPMWSLALVPFTLIVALSRIVLGLHYPSDVLGGALLGAVIGLISVVVI
jgi:undecaprenyl-diphosphatase